MKTRKLSLIIVVTLVTFSSLSGQRRAEIRDLLNQGEMFLLYEEYNEALPFYLTLHSMFPDNANYKYRIGQCYTNIPGEKHLAIPFLEEAVQDINPRYREGRLREKGAPFDALYFLAHAYQINNQLDKAIETYKLFIENMDHRVYDSTIVSFQLQTCYNAKELMGSPLYVRKNNLGDLINDRFTENNPVVTQTEDMIFFSRQLAFRTALFYSQFKDGEWTPPIDIITELEVDDKFYPTSVSPDGKTLYLYSDYDFVGNIYTSQFDGNRWNPVMKLNDNINTRYWESHASVSADGQRLYFSSNRRGGYGGLDIYVSELDSLGEWGPAKNLGPTINTPYHDDTPFIAEDGKTLYFSSRGHYNMGGYDIFVSSMLENGEWSAPLNMGYPLNSTDDDLFFTPIGEGHIGYMAKFDEDGFGRMDIFRLEIYSDDNPRSFMVRGVTRIEDLRDDIAESIRITITNLKLPGAPIVVYTNPITGKYQFELKHGDYEMIFHADGTVKEVKRLTLPLTHDMDSITVPEITLEKMDFQAVLRILTDSLINVAYGDTVAIRLITEPDSRLDIKISREGEEADERYFHIFDSLFTFKFLPEPGISIVDFTLTDRLSNVTRGRIIVDMDKPEEERITIPVYERMMSDQQARLFFELLEKYAGEELKGIIAEIKDEGHRFADINDIIDLVKKGAAEEGIPAEEVDRLALEIAVREDVLTQAAVDYLQRNAIGELREILGNLDIYEAGISTWGGLKRYVERVSEGRIDGRYLDKVARYLTEGPDPAIYIIREKLEAYANISVHRTKIKEALAATGMEYIIIPEEWFASVVAKLSEAGMTSKEIAAMIAATGFKEDTTPEEAREMLSEIAGNELKLYLDELNLRKLKIRSITDLIEVLLSDESVNFSQEDLYRTITEIIVASDLDPDSIRDEDIPGRSGIILLPVAGLLLLILLYILTRRRKKEDDDKQS